MFFSLWGDWVRFWKSRSPLANPETRMVLFVTFWLRNSVCCWSELRCFLFRTLLKTLFNIPGLFAEVQPFAARSRQDNILFSYWVVYSAILKSSALISHPDLGSFSPPSELLCTRNFYDPCIICSVYFHLKKKRNSINHLFFFGYERLNNKHVLFQQWVKTVADVRVLIYYRNLPLWVFIVYQFWLDNIKHILPGGRWRMKSCSVE